MKGLHGGIPLAVLAATARARAQVIGGPSGADVGNHASVPTENTATSSVNENFKDDHSFELEHEVKVYPPGHGHHKRVAGGPGKTVIGGPSGDDIGNGFAAATVNTFSSEVNEAYKDDHSVDVDKTTIIKPHHHRRGDNFPEVPVKPTVIGGPSGDDIGNAADIPTLNEFSSSVTESYVDNHSVDVDKNTVVKPHWRRQHSVLDGPGGDDVGSAAFLADVNEFSSSFTGKYKDDHSVDIDKTTIVKPSGHHGQEHGGSGFHHPPNKHEARGEPATVIGGPSGDDIGNFADIPTVNSFTSSFNGQYTDDHSIDVDKTFIVKPHKARAVRPGHEEEDGNDGEEGATVVGGPSGDDVGNGFAAASVNTVDTETNESVNDDHSVKVDKTEIINADDGHIHPINPYPQGHGTEQPVVHAGAQEPAPSAPAQHEPESESDPECTTSHQVVHTVTSTRTAIETATHTVWPQPAHPEAQESSYNPAAAASSSLHGQEQATAAPQYEGEQNDSEHNYSQTGSSSWNSQASEESAGSGHANGQEPASAKPQYGSEQDGSNHNYSGTESSGSGSQAPEQSSNPEYAKGQQEAPAATQYQEEPDSSNSDPKAGSSWSDSQAPENSSNSGYTKGQQEAPAAPQYGSEHDDSNQNYSGTSSSGSGSQAPEQSSNSEYTEGQQETATAPQYGSEHDNSDPKVGSSWSDFQAPEQSSNSEYTKGQQETATAPQYGSKQDGSNHNYSGTGSSGSGSQAPKPSSNVEYGKGQQEAPTAAQYGSEHDGSNHNYSGTGSSGSGSQAPVQSSNAQYSGQSGTSSEHQSPSQDQGEDKSSDEWSSPSYSNEEESDHAKPAPAASEVYYGVQSSHAAWDSTPTSMSHGSHAYSHLQYQPSPTSQGAYHAPGASAITVAEASSFSVIPVFVPSGTAWAHAHGSVVVASSSTPVSSAYRVHNAAVPTGASAEQNHRHSPSPSSSSSTDGVAEFTGGAGRVAKIEGLCGVLVGVFTLLAFAL
ncbi:hypothetical protein BDW72DRAFT_5685 [Aspergillus terricola var. indicus]